MTVAETVADWLARTTAHRLPPETVEMSRKLFLDVAGLCIAARRAPYVTATMAAVDRPPEGSGAVGVAGCTAIGHEGVFDAFGAALVNGTAAHGEDFDDTFEGGPVHSGAVIVPAVLAACERERLGGDRLLVGIVTGVGAPVPPQPRGADGDAQCRVSPDGGVRRDRRGRRGRCGAATAARRLPRRSASPAAWRRASSNTWRRAPGPSGCTPGGPPNPACAPRSWRAAALLARARC